MDKRLRPARPQDGRVRAHCWPVLALAAAWPALSWSQAPVPAPVAPAQQPVFPIKGFQVTGENPLGDGETARVLAPFLRSQATIETLQQATAALEAGLRERGFGLYRVSLPPQEVGDTVKLAIVKFTVGKVAVEGNQIRDTANIRRAVPELREGGTPNFKRMAVQTAIANENPNRQVQVGLRESEVPDTIDATISVRESRPWNLSLSASNAGSRSTGRDRVTVAGSHSNLFNLDHQFVGAYTTSAERPSDVRQLGLSYRAPLYAAGAVVGATYTRSDVVGNFGAFTSTGAGHTFGLQYTAYLPPQGGRRSYIALGIEDKVFDAARINDIRVPGARDRRSRPVVLGYNARTESDRSAWGYNVDLAVNTGSGTHNELSAYRSEDPRIDKLHWAALRLGINYLAPVAGNWLLSLRGQAQYSPDVLISGEQFGLGGVSSVRGTRQERPISGDMGAAGSAELSTPELAQGLRAVGFLDAGWLGNNSPTNAFKPSSDTLAGAGIGLRFARGPVALSADYGRLIKGSRVPLTLNASAPRRGDDRLYVTLSLRF